MHVYGLANAGANGVAKGIGLVGSFAYANTIGWATGQTTNEIQEKYVGKALFVRSNKNVKLTKSGEAFLSYAKRILLLKKDGIIKARSVGIY